MMIGIIIQARMSSSRLPGKVLMPIADKPMIVYQYERLKQTQKAIKVIVATSNDTTDDALASVCQAHNIPCFRGDLNDVLARYYHCAQAHQLTHIVRICGDCPLIDATLVEHVIDTHLAQQADYTSNCLVRSYPDGQDIEVFSMNALKRAYHDAKRPSEREHVTPFIRECGHFKLVDVIDKVDNGKLRICVDHPADFQVISEIAKSFIDNTYSYQNIIDFLAHNPQVRALNADIEINEGYTLSLQQDKEQGF